MKRLISILFLLTLLVQAIPVFHFFSERSEVFYTSLDEDKPEETKVEKAKKEIKEQFTLHFIATAFVAKASYFAGRRAGSLPAPYVESLIHPPDAAC